MWPERLSMNLQTLTATPKPLGELLDACLEAGVPAIGLYRPPHVEPLGFRESLKLVRDAGMPVTIYSSVGFWAASQSGAGKPHTQDDNRRILDEAAEFGASVVGTVGGGMAPGDTDIRGARERAWEGLLDLVPYAKERNLTLGLEANHPWDAPVRQVFLTFKSPVDMMEEINDETVTVVVDTYHHWWEHDLSKQLNRARGRVSLVQISDWKPLGDPFHRVLMGEGCIDFNVFLEGLTDFNGWYEAEILRCEAFDSLPLSEMLSKTAESYQQTIGRFLPASK